MTEGVWTYQEVVNSQDLLFTGHGMFGKFIRGVSFLNRFGALSPHLEGSEWLQFFRLREKYPFLDAFEYVVLGLEEWRGVSREVGATSHVTNGQKMLRGTVPTSSMP